MRTKHYQFFQRTHAEGGHERLEVAGVAVVKVVLGPSSPLLVLSVHLIQGGVQRSRRADLTQQVRPAAPARILHALSQLQQLLQLRAQRSALAVLHAGNAFSNTIEYK